MALIPAAFLMIMLGIYFVKHEKTYPMIPILLCYLGLIAYLISRIVLLCGHTRRANTAGKDMMLLFAFAALVSTLSTFCCAVVCVLNFDNGLKRCRQVEETSCARVVLVSQWRLSPCRL
ncbi:hypothetical protein HAV15_004976 [Penicillium sp. str. |nr:hypothetical protein HAV15_004976 [Penicillium sp. str. \